MEEKLFVEPTINEEIEDVSASTRKFINKHYKKHVKWGIVAGAVFDLAVLGGLIWSFQQGHEPDARMFLFLFVPVAIYFIFYSHIAKKIRRKFYEQFALVNGFTYFPYGWETGLDGAIFMIGHNPKQEDIIVGSVTGHKMTMLNYTYTVGSGKSSRTYGQTVLEIEFKDQLPPVMLLVDHHSFGGIKPKFENSYKYNLEEDYDNFFDLYVQKKMEMEVLQIFSKDFMAQTKEKWRQFSIEFQGNQLYIYSNKIISTKVELQSMFALAKYLTEHILPKIKNIGSSVEAMKEAFAPKRPAFQAGSAQVLAEELFNHAASYPPAPKPIKVMNIIGGLLVGFIIIALIAIVFLLYA